MPQPGHPAGLADAFQSRDLHGDRPLQGRVRRPPHLPEAALGNQPFQPVAPADGRRDCRPGLGLAVGGSRCARPSGVSSQSIDLSLWTEPSVRPAVRGVGAQSARARPPAPAPEAHPTGQKLLHPFFPGHGLPLFTPKALHPAAAGVPAWRVRERLLTVRSVTPRTVAASAWSGPRTRAGRRPPARLPTAVVPFRGSPSIPPGWPAPRQASSLFATGLSPPACPAPSVWWCAAAAPSGPK